jgi:hypothetical protein
MKFKGDIVITDPCYIMPKNGDEKVRFTDFLPAEAANRKLKDFTEHENKKYQEYLKAVEGAKKLYPDYWRNGDIDIFGSGSGLEKFGFTNWIWEDTIYGDWGCTTYELKESSIDIEKDPNEIERNDVKRVLGRFCADAGLVGVFYLNEILKFNPDFKYPVNDYGCELATVIKDFDGDVEYLISEFDGEESAYIKGTGNVNFITSQTSL